MSDGSLTITTPGVTGVGGDPALIDVTEVVYSVTIEEADVKVVAACEQGPVGAQGEMGLTGLTGATGPIGGVGPPAEYLVFNQEAAASTWTIAYSFARIPVVTVFDTAGNRIGLFDVQYIDSAVVLNFSAPFSGTALLS